MQVSNNIYSMNSDIRYYNTVPQNQKINFRGTTDTVEISGKSSKPKKKNTFKIVAGLAALASLVIVGAVIYHKKTQVKFEEVKEAFSSVFQKQYTEEEINELLAKYRDIYNKKGSANYYDDFINQLKQDYGIKDVKTTLSVTEGAKVKAGDHVHAGLTDALGNITLTPDYFKYLGTDFNAPFHEIKHVKQFADAYRTDKNLFVDALYENILNSKNPEQIQAIQKSVQKVIDLNKKNGINISPEEARELVKKEDIKHLLKKTEEVYGKLEPYKKDSAEYRKGLEYIDSMIKHVKPIESVAQDYNGYREQMHEKEAWDIGTFADTIFKYIKQHK